MKINYRKTLWVILFAIFVSGFAIELRAQDLVNMSAFTNSRPAGKAAAGKGQGGAKAAAGKMAYRKQSQLASRRHKSTSANGTKVADASKSNAGKATDKVAAAEKLGITLWKLRPEQNGDTGARLLTMKTSTRASSKMVAERVGLDTVFKMGEKVRLSVESPREGYLYIIDRELHKDNTLGAPSLIFPTTKTLGGNNKVFAGKVIEIPAQTDDQVYFDITPYDENYAGELLTAIISPTKIEGLTISDLPLKLSNAQVEKWEDDWERAYMTFELESARGLTYTEEEKEAGSGKRQLTQNSPAPQTLVTIDASKGKPFLVSFPLKVAK